MVIHPPALADRRHSARDKHARTTVFETRQQMRLIAFITEGTETDKILEHIGVESEPPPISPARGPPLWDDCDAQVDEGVEIEPG
jgi:hypothetical protein